MTQRPGRAEGFVGKPMLPPSQKFYEPKKKVRMAGGDDYFTDMAGRQVRRQDLTSQNTVPFFGRQKAVGPSLTDHSEQTLDTMTGGGSMQITKSEVAPLFNPDENVQYAHGAPNQSDFFQSRVNPGASFRNVKPFQDIKVGPGLDHGFTGGGNAGFNSGLEARDKYTEKNVDQLRVATKPKETFTYEGHQGPAMSSVTNRGIEGKFEKNLPDRYFVNTPDRYLTTVGAETAPTYRSKQMAPDVHRVHNPYVGAAGNSGVQEQPQKPLVQKDHRQQFLTPLNLTPAQASVPGNGTEAQLQGMSVYDNNRTTTQPERGGNLSVLISALAAPILDLLRPTRKETTLIPKHLGNPFPTVQNLPLLPSNVALKDPSLFSPLERGARPFKKTDDGYQMSTLTIEPNQRQTTHTAYSGGVSGGILPKPASYEANYNAFIETSRENQDRIAIGSTNLFSGEINQSTTNTKKHVPYMGSGPGALFSPPPMAQFNETRTPQSYDMLKRNEPDILDAFKANPYTHSLQSVA